MNITRSGGCRVITLVPSLGQLSPTSHTAGQVLRNRGQVYQQWKLWTQTFRKVLTHSPQAYDECSTCYAAQY